ncbi:GIY-YIG nuclease family protein [Sphingomonas tagetis]|uniref:GIY-YIG nuclease family protein n=1 Tax=Sphingomonas tagetis TaxID=2949092 RepID=UPI00345E8DAD
MGRWTREHSEFLRSHGIDDPRALSLNATGMTRREYQAALSANDRLFAYGVQPCPKGHTLRVSGGCPQCNSGYLQRARHNILPGFVYVARSNIGRLIKVGSSTDPEKRIYNANCDGYGGEFDWKLKGSAPVAQMGRAETAIQRALSGYRVSRQW